MAYTVKQLADLAGVSVRTLHYYDEIGLLNLSRVGQNGYRFYEEEALFRLQQILFFRELDLSLNEVKAIIDMPDFDLLAALEQLHATTAREVQGGEPGYRVLLPRPGPGVRPGRRNNVQVNLIPTNEYCHRIIEAPDAATREQLYIELLVTPWQQMMGTMLGPDDVDDPLAGARAWAWLLPDDLTQVPASLAKLEAANAWTVAAEALAQGASRFDAYADHLPIDRVEGWLVLADPARSDPVMGGYTGSVDWFAPRFIGQYDTVNEENIRRLPGLIVHEMHHLIRLRLFPWHVTNTSVADYIIHEGLAESFAVSLFGETCLGHYVTDFDDDELATARRLIGEGLNQTGFNILRAYIFGDHWSEKLGIPKVGMPTYGGYAIGFHVVQAFLARTGKTVMAATFLPADEIVRESGFFAA